MRLQLITDILVCCKLATNPLMTWYSLISYHLVEALAVLHETIWWLWGKGIMCAKTCLLGIIDNSYVFDYCKNQDLEATKECEWLMYKCMVSWVILVNGAREANNYSCLTSWFSILISPNWWLMMLMIIGKSWMRNEKMKVASFDCHHDFSNWRRTTGIPDWWEMRDNYNCNITGSSWD